jgi:hypothetical protein
MTEVEKFLIQTLLVLSRGCTYHYYYKGKNPPTTDCDVCKEVFNNMQKWLQFKQANNL